MSDFYMPWEDGTYTVIINNLDEDQVVQVFLDICHGGIEPDGVMNPYKT